MKKIVVRESIKNFAKLSIVLTVLSYSEPRDLKLKYIPYYLGDFQHMQRMFTDPAYRYLMTEAPLCALPTNERR